MDKETKEMLKNFMDILQEIKEELQKINSSQVTPKVLPLDPTGKEIPLILNELGFQHNLKGYSYWNYGLSWALTKDPKDIAICKGLNQHIVDNFNVSLCSVDRALRHSIHSAFKKNPQAFKTLFPAHEKAPSISEFLYRMIDYIQMGH